MSADVAAGWSLHPQLAQDTMAAGDLPLCRVLLINDSNYPWLLLVPRRAEASEIIDLNAADRTQLLSEITRAAELLKAASRCDKLNIAALGNVVPQLHVHIIARYSSDPAWPKPVWGVAPPKAYDPPTQQRWIDVLRRELGLTHPMT